MRIDICFVSRPFYFNIIIIIIKRPRNKNRGGYIKIKGGAVAWGQGSFTQLYDMIIYFLVTSILPSTLMQNCFPEHLIFFDLILFSKIHYDIR